MKTYTDPRMHTAEHLLNATMVRLFGTERSFRAHIEKKKSKCDYRLAAPPAGCAFHPRCPIYAARRSHLCVEKAPPLEETRPGHRVACYERDREG